MKKIFKYELVKDNDQWYANCPEGQVIRTDYVNDGYYEGNFVWIIVDPDDKNIQTREIVWVDDQDEYSLYKYYRKLIGLTESQVISIPCSSEIGGVASSDGFFFVYYTVEGFESSPVRERYKNFEIRGYKTGQEITVPIEEYAYLGCGKIWIKQELAVYFFAKEIK